MYINQHNSLTCRHKISLDGSDRVLIDFNGIKMPLKSIRTLSEILAEKNIFKDEVRFLCLMAYQP